MACMLTTIDNPFNPFTHFDEWFVYDTQMGYNSCAYLDRIASVSLELPTEEASSDIEAAIDEIIKYDFRGIYIKVTDDKSDETSTKSAEEQ